MYAICNMKVEQKNVENLVAAGGNNTDYLQLAKKGGGHHGKIIS